MELVYHASANHGITLFSPRRFWQQNDFRYTSRLQDGENPPDGASVFYAVFATDRVFVPFYFTPSGISRIYLSRAKHRFHFDNAVKYLGIDTRAQDRVLLFDSRDKARLESHVFSLYEFDRADFRKLPTNEYIAERPVMPRSETLYQNGLREIVDSGIYVHFVSNLGSTFNILQQANITFDAQGSF